MDDFKEENAEEWKKVLRTAFITGMSGNEEDRMQACADVGYYYMCYAPSSLYKYYRDNPTINVASLHEDNAHEKPAVKFVFLHSGSNHLMYSSLIRCAPYWRPSRKALRSYAQHNRQQRLNTALLSSRGRTHRNSSSSLNPSPISDGSDSWDSAYAWYS